MGTYDATVNAIAENGRIVAIFQDGFNPKDPTELQDILTGIGDPMLTTMENIEKAVAIGYSISITTYDKHYWQRKWKTPFKGWDWFWAQIELGRYPSIEEIQGES